MKNIPKIHESEYKVLNTLWEESPLSASEIAARLGKRVGWSKNTAYTVLTKLVNKGMVKRSDPGFVCTPILKLDEVRVHETKSLVDKLYKGSVKLMFARLIDDSEISEEELAELKAMLEQRSET